MGCPKTATPVGPHTQAGNFRDRHSCAEARFVQHSYHTAPDPVLRTEPRTTDALAIAKSPSHERTPTKNRWGKCGATKYCSRSDHRSAVAIVKPETVVAWHRKGFRLFWNSKVRHGQPGRLVISREVRDLIRKMCRENSSWGAPRIHGELLKLGIDIGESSVSKYIVRSRKPPSQTWRTFLENHT